MTHPFTDLVLYKEPREVVGRAKPEGGGNDKTVSDTGGVASLKRNERLALAVRHHLVLQYYTSLNFVKQP